MPTPIQNCRKVRNDVVSRWKSLLRITSVKSIAKDNNCHVGPQKVKMNSRSLVVEKLLVFIKISQGEGERVIKCTR